MMNDFIDSFILKDTNPIISNHIVYDKALLPGLAYIDLLYQSFREQGYEPNQLELRNLTILQPFVIEKESQIKIEIVAEVSQRRFWKVSIQSIGNGQEQKDTAVSTIYVTSEMHVVSPINFEKSIDKKDLFLSNQKGINLEEHYAQFRASGLIHTGLMKSQGTVYHTDNTTIVDISLNDEAQLGSDSFIVHPALIDGVGVATSQVFVSLIKNEQLLFLPIHIGSFSTSAAFGDSCLATVSHDSVERKGEVISQTTEYYNKLGDKIAELVNFRNKLVRDPNLTTKQVVSSAGNNKILKREVSSVKGSEIRSAEYLLRELLGSYLKIDPLSIPVDMGYYEMGLDSNGLIEVVKALETRLDTTLVPTLLFEYSNIKDLSILLNQEYPQYFSTSNQTFSVTERITPQLKNIDRAANPIESASYNNCDVAVIGMSGKYPGAENLEDFWNNLCQGKDCVTEIPATRWNSSKYKNLKSPSGKALSKWGGFVKGVDLFDPKFFRISPREAEIMDPQERLFLEVCWEAIEDGGYTPDSLVVPKGQSKRNSVGVFVGVMHKDYAELAIGEVNKGNLMPISMNHGPVANRVSYVCNFHGPSMAIDTLCSSSLTAVHQALESIYSGSSEVALAGGVNLSLSKSKYISYGLTDMHSSNGRCNTFGAGGDGYVPADGIGVVLLKPLSAAEKDKDHIYAVIKGSSVNHGGKASGLTVPNQTAQADLITNCLVKSNVDPRSISYVEAHGTGTSLGDPIEIEGLSKAFQRGTNDTQFCAIGSVKSNIGHAESAAGISGLTKAILQLHHKILVPSLHSEKLNPFIDFESSPFYVQQRLEEWRVSKNELEEDNSLGPRRASVSSFGATGSNAHVVLEEYIYKENHLAQSERPLLIPLSARTKENLKRYVQRLHDFLERSEMSSALWSNDDIDYQSSPPLEKELSDVLASLCDIDAQEFELQQDWKEMGIENSILSKFCDTLCQKYNLEIQFEEILLNNSIEQLSSFLSNKGRYKNTTDDIELESEKVNSPFGDTESVARVNLESLAYTLQTGRLSLNKRVLFQVTSVKDLLTSLKKYLNSEKDLCRYEGDLSKNDKVASIFKDDSDCDTLLDSWIAKEKYNKVAEMWCSGIPIKWDLLYNTYTPRKISLPTYPFSKENYWLPTTNNTPYTDPSSLKNYIHPFLQVNISDLTKQKYSTTFNGTEFCLTDHIFQKRAILPGVAYLEMGRAAIEDAAVEIIRPSDHIAIENAVWLRPIEYLNELLNIYISVNYNNDSGFSFDIYSLDSENKKILHGQGGGQLSAPYEKESLNLSEALVRCSKMEYQHEDIYLAFQQIGFDYGIGHKGLRSMHIGSEEVLAYISIPNEVRDQREELKLHPTIMDAAFQASVGLLIGDSSGENELTSSLPFALDKIEILGDCNEEHMIAHIVRSNDSSERVFKSDIKICSVDGEVKVKIYGLSSRPVEPTKSETKADTLLLAPSWRQIERAQNIGAHSERRHLVIFCGFSNEKAAFQNKFEQYFECLWLDSDEISLNEKYKDLSIQMFEVMKVELGNKNSQDLVVQLVVSSDLEGNVIGGLSGILRSAKLENPKITGQLVEVENDSFDEHLLKRLKLDADNLRDIHVKYAGDQRYLLNWSEYENEYSDILPWRDEATYIITGGLGGLGLIFAEEIIRRTNGVNLILLGRSKVNSEKRQIINDLNQSNTNVIYRKVDITSKKEVSQLVRSVKDEYGNISGIIHSAGVLRDNFIIKKNKTEVKEVLSPKVDGAVHLDLITKEENMDFFVFFSSGAGVMGNAGQCDYAAANAFLDRYAYFRNGLVAEGERYGKTISINWPLWEDGGMTVDEAILSNWNKNIGIKAMPSERGVSAFYSSFQSDYSQVMVLYGDQVKLRNIFLNPTNDAQPKIKSTKVVTSEFNQSSADEPNERAIHYFKDQFSVILKIPFEEIDEDTDMNEYGLDSVMVITLTTELEPYFGSLSKTLFFEYQTIREIADYFLNEHESSLKVLLGEANVTSQNEVKQELVEKPLQSSIEIRSDRIRLDDRTNFKIDRSPFSDDIAIVGLSGKYPGANNINEYWENLKNGIDSITEIPSDRWDYGINYDENKDSPGKTNSKWGGFINGVAEFDPLFFKITPIEAEIIDPQERLFLQCVYETLEDAGYTRKTIKDSKNKGKEEIGVFVGVMYQEYQLFGAEETLKGTPIALSGNSSSIANRISYFFDFKGPSLAIDTMCSSSISAIHLACQSIKAGDCSQAIAGGVNLSIHPNKYLMLGQGNFVSSKGRCESFGAGGDGYVPGEGIGAILLKPLSKALEDGDHLYGVIKSTAVNHGGKTNGYTVPNPNAQAEVITKAIKSAGIHPRTISYVEAHGTGTSLGDPIEMRGLDKAFKNYTSENAFCAIGSAKSNIGHCESAAGIAGLTKVLLQLKNQKLVPSLHSKLLNENIDFDRTAFVVQQKLVDWKRPVVEIDNINKEYPLRAGLSAFGAGGSNAHMIIEEYRGEKRDSELVDFSQGLPFVLSAQSSDQVIKLVEKLIAYIEERTLSDFDFKRISYTLLTGREYFNCRLGIVAFGAQDLLAKLKSFGSAGNDLKDTYSSNIRKEKEWLRDFNNDSGSFDKVNEWLEQNDISNLTRVWVKGVNINWNELFSQERIQRISLPTYPFAKDYCWIATSDDLPKDKAVLDKKIGNSRQRSYLKKNWTTSRITENNNLPQSVLLLSTSSVSSLVQSVAGQFENSRILNLDYLSESQLLEELGSIQYECVLDFVGCGEELKLEYNWLLILQTIVDQSSEANAKLLICVTRDLEYFEINNVNVAGANHAGIYRMLQSEYKNILSRHVDLSSASSDDEMIYQIIAECTSAHSSSEICYRNGSRYIATLESVNLENRYHFSFDSSKALLVTGGTRGVGFLIASHLVAKYGVKKLILTGRQKFPPREEWYLYEKKDTSLGHKIRNITRLESQGVKIIVLSVALNNYKDVEKALDKTKTEFGEIGGFIHCAGITSNNKYPAFIKKPMSEMKEVLEPKIQGLICLFDYLKNEPLEFGALISSVSAVIPVLGIGQADYGLANSFMDYFARAHHKDYPILSIQWPNWKDTGVGEVKSVVYDQTGLLAHTDSEGLELLDALLDNFNECAPVVLPAIVDPSLYEPSDLLRRNKNVEKTTLLVQRLVLKDKKLQDIDQLKYLIEPTEQFLLELFSNDLKIPLNKLEKEVPFQDYGVDSILMAQLSRSLNKELSIELEPTVLYEYSSIELLAKYLVQSQTKSLESKLQTSGPIVAEEVSNGKVNGISRDSSIVTSKEPRKSYEKQVDTGKFKEPINRIKVELNNGQEKRNGEKIEMSKDVVVIGMSCRFPGAESLDQYWDLLANGKCALREVPKDRWDGEGAFYGGFLETRKAFDHQSFLLAEEDVRAMDPQALMVLEESLATIEQAGYTTDDVKGKDIGVFIGGRSQHIPSGDSIRSARNPIVAVGQNYLSANVSQFFDFRGPNMVVDTACSSALVCMNLGIQAIQNGEINMALVGGVSLQSNDAAFQLFGQRSLLSGSNEFHAFDKRAKGVVISEGIGMVLLKTREEAEKDGDKIYGVIRALSVNSDGRTPGPATPSLSAQKEVMRKALKKSGLAQDQIGYVETNASGSEMTDLLELKALEEVYGNRQENLSIGSLKPNIGHPLCAEGIAGFIKVILMLSHGSQVPFLSGQEPMKFYSMEKSPFYFQRSLIPWESRRRVAALNCFADGGTNAHVIIEEGSFKFEDLEENPDTFDFDETNVQLQNFEKVTVELKSQELRTSALKERQKVDSKDLEKAAFQNDPLILNSGTNLFWKRKYKVESINDE